MKKVSYIILLLMLGLGTSAQKLTPVIKEGTVFKYTFYLHGQTSPFQITLNHIADSLLLGWNIRGLAAGTYIVSASGLNNGTSLSFAQPEAFKKVKLGASQTFCMISRSAFKELVAKHQFTYDNTVYELQSDSTMVMIDNQPLDVLHVTAQNETTEFWILNNPDFPIICQSKANPLGINMKLNAITQP
ncbi:hypothetical protein [Mucilaginibacter polytrichastri]|uniref:Uncharacterized protein n=1 Tax=Mucilaginibacter polytrichastri TaxID=1302689 RepID=A0A1Q6A0F7_9SPHI|nr:hypothetical protein [Mucilaginibacter polytrichastri]OKS87462.1 hypothetical protein RG47T_2923 [Mucilaginibacter polytrichastri]SFS90932.1 hypothetical protein SAMN04487890_10657 [Mucilaginibacter polytrichastri]